MGYVFISYSSKNLEYADAMRNLLKNIGVKTWMAPGDIPAGSTYAGVITRALKGSDCLVLLLTDDSQKSTWVDKEVAFSVYRIFTQLLLLYVSYHDMLLHHSHLGADPWLLCVPDFSFIIVSLSILSNIDLHCNTHSNSNTLRFLLSPASSLL